MTKERGMKGKRKMFDTDIHAYFRQHRKHASKNGKAENVWARSADTLARGGIKTIGDLVEIKSDVDLIRCFIDFESPGKELDDEGYDFANKMRSKYSRDAHREELLASGEVLVEEYFSAHGPHDAPNGATTRASTSLRRIGIETMRQLADATPEMIARARNMGGKTLPVALALREKYMEE